MKSKILKKSLEKKSQKETKDKKHRKLDEDALDNVIGGTIGNKGGFTAGGFISG